MWQYIQDKVQPRSIFYKVHKNIILNIGIVLGRLDRHVRGILPCYREYSAMYVGPSSDPASYLSPTPVVYALDAFASMLVAIFQAWQPHHFQMAWYCCFYHWCHKLLLPCCLLCCLHCHHGIWIIYLPSHRGLHTHQFLRSNCCYHPLLWWHPGEATHQVLHRFSFWRGW